MKSLKQRNAQTCAYRIIKPLGIYRVCFQHTRSENQLTGGDESIDSVLILWKIKLETRKQTKVTVYPVKLWKNETWLFHFQSDIHLRDKLCLQSFDHFVATRLDRERSNWNHPRVKKLDNSGLRNRINKNWQRWWMVNIADALSELSLGWVVIKDIK